MNILDHLTPVQVLETLERYVEAFEYAPIGSYGLSAAQTSIEADLRQHGFLALKTFRPMTLEITTKGLAYYYAVKVKYLEGLMEQAQTLLGESMPILDILNSPLSAQIRDFVAGLFVDPAIKTGDMVKLVEVSQAVYVVDRVDEIGYKLINTQTGLIRHILKSEYDLKRVLPAQYVKERLNDEIK